MRLRRGLTPAQMVAALAKAGVHVCRTMTVRWELDEREPRPSLLRAWAAVCRERVGTLFGEVRP